jgi:hypothetical protein
MIWPGDSLPSGASREDRKNEHPGEGAHLPILIRYHANTHFKKKKIKSNDNLRRYDFFSFGE